MVLRIQQIAFVTENTLTPCVQADSARVTLATMSTRQWEKEEQLKWSRLREVSLSLSLSSETVNREGKKLPCEILAHFSLPGFRVTYDGNSERGTTLCNPSTSAGPQVMAYTDSLRFLFISLGIGMVQLENSIKLKSRYSCAWSLGSTERVVVTVKWTRTSCLIKILVRKIWNGI